MLGFIKNYNVLSTLITKYLTHFNPSIFKDGSYFQFHWVSPRLSWILVPRSIINRQCSLIVSLPETFPFDHFGLSALGLSSGEQEKLKENESESNFIIPLFILVKLFIGCLQLLMRKIHQSIQPTESSRWTCGRGDIMVNKNKID